MRPRTSTLHRQARLTEALLLLLVLLVLTMGSCLLVTAKGASVPAPDTTTNINRADAANLARALGVPATIAKRLADERAQRGGFGDVDAVGRVALVPHPRSAAAVLRTAGLSDPQTAAPARVVAALHLDTATAARLAVVRGAYPKAKWERVLATSLLPTSLVSEATPRLTVRTWAEARNSFMFWAAGLAAFFVLTHFLLRRVCPGADPFLLPIAAFLSVLGYLVLFALKDPVRDMPSFVAQAQGIIGGGGVALLAALWLGSGRVPLHRYNYVYALAALGGTLLLGLAGIGPGGVHLSVGGAQPVEFIKVLLVFFLAAYLAERADVLNDPLHRWGPFAVPRRADVGPLLLLYALPLVLFALVKDLGPVLLLFGTFLLLAYLATGRGVYVTLGLAALLVGGFIGYRLHFGVFQTRVEMWLHPWANDRKGGDHLALGLWGLASGGPWGSGLGLGGSRFIPRGGSDLVFASIGEETGLIGAGAVVLCFAAVFARGLRIASRAATDFDRYLAVGLSGLLATQALIIVCGILGLLPLTGITLPLVAYGKSSLVASFFTFGMLLALSNRAAATAPAPTPLHRVASARLALAFAGFFALAVVPRLVWVQAMTPDSIAGRAVRVPDADGVARPHINPRTLLLAAQIGRGRILDRGGVVLAETRNRHRLYPQGGATAHLVGYLDAGVGGPVGAEKLYDGTLRGFDTWASLVPLWRRKDLPGFHLPQGGDVSLALDTNLQRAALDALVAGAKTVRDRRTGKPKSRGAVVVLDVLTGEIRAAVTAPTYDPNTLTPAAMQAMSANRAGDLPLINRAAMGYYPPGSTFKIVTAAALLANGRGETTWTCHHIAENLFWHANGGETFARRRVVDDETDSPHGTVDLNRAVAQSCNVYFAHAGLTLGEKPLRDEAALFSFARLPSLHDVGANLPDVAYGQGPMLATPLEMAGVAQTVANGGRRLHPQYLHGKEAEVLSTPLTPADATRLAGAMREVVVSGTAARKFDGLPFTVAGKTGTAQNGQGDKMSHSWFIGFAPADRPRVAVAVLVENGGYGASVAVPVARKVLEVALRAR